MRQNTVVEYPCCAQRNLIATEYADRTDPRKQAVARRAAASRLVNITRASDPLEQRVRVAGRSAGPDEDTGDQDHEPTCVPHRFVILISRVLMPRGARRHERVLQTRHPSVPSASSVADPDEAPALSS